MAPRYINKNTLNQLKTAIQSVLPLDYNKMVCNFTQTEHILELTNVRFPSSLPRKNQAGVLALERKQPTATVVAAVAPAPPPPRATPGLFRRQDSSSSAYGITGSAIEAPAENEARTVYPNSC
jgi:hypothetical protein